MPSVVSIIGRSGSGKTTLLEKIIRILCSRGYRVGTIKHHVHEFMMDSHGKDTWRHKQAGAHVVALSSPTGLGIIRDSGCDTPIEELVRKYFDDVDIVLTEGYKHAATPKIEVYRHAVHGAPLGNRDKTWIAMVCDVPAPPDLQSFTFNEMEGLADFVEDHFIRNRPQAFA